MKLTDKRSIKADWSAFLRRPPWSFVTSRELSRIVNVSLQTINNWKMRGILPEPSSHPKLKGNYNYYRISAIRSWLENRPEEDIQWEWVTKYLDNNPPYTNLQQAQYVAEVCYNIFEVEKPLISVIKR